MYAISLTTGTRAWTVDLETSLRGDAMTWALGRYHENTFYATSSASRKPHYVYALNAENGTVKWTYDLSVKGYGNYGGTSVNRVEVVDNKVIVSSSRGIVFALDPKDGREIWIRAVESAALDENIFGPTVGNGKLFYVGDKRKLFAVDIATGNDAWSSSYDFDCGSRSEPAFHDGIVYAADLCYGASSHVSAVDASNGKKIWKVTLTNAVVYSADIMYGDGMLFCGLYEGGAVYALDASDGSIEWTFATDGKAVQTDMVLDEGVLYVGVNRKVYALHIANGEKKWEFAPEGDVSSLTVNGGNICFGTHNGHIYCLNKATGLFDASR